MDTKQRRPKPRLDRVNALKYIHYAPPSTSPSPSPSPSSSSLLLDSRFFDQSIRVKGIDDGEFDHICRALGLSGPEDFAIPTADWESRKSRNLTSSSRLQSLFDSDCCSSSDDSSGSSSCCVGIIFDQLAKRTSVEGLRSPSRDKTSSNLVGYCQDGNRGRVCRSSFCKLETQVFALKEDNCGAGNKARGSQGGEFGGLNIVSQTEFAVCVKDFEGGGGRGRGREGNIKGLRPQILTAPQVIFPYLEDNASSTGNIGRSFGPQDNNHRENEIIISEIHSSTANKDENIEDKDGVASPFDSAMNSDSLYIVSPNGKFRRRIASWQKGQLLGSGSFGTVYEGFTDNGFFFAVKEVSLLDQGSQGQQSILQLEQEISLLSQFEHENIVRYLGTDKDDSKLYIFLELVTKGSLASLYNKYHLRDSQVSAYTKQILNGLKYLHEQNVVHRDIKCANILVDANGSVKLADFGLAKATKVNDAKSCKGTAFWMAPEVVNIKNRSYGLTADIWSLGCTVLEMLTRQPPYCHLDGMQALFRIGRGEPPQVPSSLSRDARDFIQRCLQVNPSDRPTAAQLLDHSFVKKPLDSISGSLASRPSSTLS